MNAINWFEIPTADFQRAKKFYSQILGIEMYETKMGPYEMAFFPSAEQAVSGALVHGDGYKPSSNGSVVYLNGGEDLTAVLDRVEAAGGTVLMPKTQITPEFGYYAFFTDSEGNKMGLHSMN